MIFFFKPALPIVILLGLFSCNNSNLYTSSDYTGSLFTEGIEGPAVDLHGNLYAVNYKTQGTVGIISPDKKADLFITLPKESIGNGIRFNSQGNMFIADYFNHNILLVDMKTKQVSVYAHDSSMNQPNDIAISKKDILYASDPSWKNSTGKLWMITPDGKTTLLEDSMGTTNGVEVSTSEKILYVNESIQKNVWAYDILPNGTVNNKRLFIKFNDEHGMDGMRCDMEGNLYITRYGKGTVVKLSSDGKIVKEISLKGNKPTNIAFGGKDGKTCFVTLQDRGIVECFQVESQGREWQLSKK